MKIQLILGHPNPGSLNGTLAQRLKADLERAGHQVNYHDLYQEGFDPVIPLSEMRRRGSFDPLASRYAAELRASGGLLVVHPDWWGLPPAIIKGWVDRVFLPGVAYAYETLENGAILNYPLLEGKKSLVLVTRDDEQAGLCEAFWSGQVFAFCGIRDSMVLKLGPLKSMDTIERGLAVEDAAAKALAWFSPETA